jgi:hypothetical protein
MRLRVCSPWRASSWKFSQLYFEDADLLYRPRLVELRLVYRKYSGKFALPNEISTMSFEVRLSPLVPCACCAPHPLWFRATFCAHV